MARGILATSDGPDRAEGVTDAEIRGAWEAAYGDETFVQLLPAGEFPRTADVLGRQHGALWARHRPAGGEPAVVVVAAVDNLGQRQPRRGHPVA